MEIFLAFRIRFAWLFWKAVVIDARRAKWYSEIMPEDKYPTPEVNLLSEDELNYTAGGKFIKWALTWGRRIIVITELIVISAFLSRFWLDTIVADNNEKIEEKRAVILSFAEVERQYREIAHLVNEAQKIEKTAKVLRVYDEANKLIPAGVTVDQVNVDNKNISFSGWGSEELLQIMITNFRSAENFSDITVERVAAERVDAVNFSLRASYGG